MRILRRAQKQAEVVKPKTPEQEAVEQAAAEQIDIQQHIPVVEEKPVEEVKAETKEAKKSKPRRQELHVASDKRGKRKAKPKPRRPGKVAPSDKHQFEKPVEPIKREILVPESDHVVPGEACFNGLFSGELSNSVSEKPSGSLK